MAVEPPLVGVRIAELTERRRVLADAERETERLRAALERLRAIAYRRAQVRAAILWLATDVEHGLRPESLTRRAIATELEIAYELAFLKERGVVTEREGTYRANPDRVFALRKPRGADPAAWPTHIRDGDKVVAFERRSLTQPWGAKSVIGPLVARDRSGVTVGEHRIARRRLDCLYLPSLHVDSLTSDGFLREAGLVRRNGSRRRH